MLFRHIDQMVVSKHIFENSCWPSNLKRTINRDVRSLAKKNIYKTAGYHQHILRLPTLVKMHFWKMRTLLFLKKTFSSSYFLNFPTFKVYCFFCQINLIMRAEKTFLRNITIWYAFYSKFATLSDLIKIQNFSKNPSILWKNPNFERFEKFYDFSRILRQGCYNWMQKIDIQTREQPMLARLRELNRQTSGKKRTYLRGRFCFPYSKEYGTK